MSLSDQEIARYRRQMALPEIGAPGQERLSTSRVLVIGAGGLGSPLLLFLAGAGVGHLGIVDFDYVELSNLHRQILHTTDRIDTAKTESARVAVRALNPHVELIEHAMPINVENADALVAGYDLVADGSDNFATRDAVHAACFARRIPLVSAAIQVTSGILTTFKAYLGRPHPCYRCLYPEALPRAVTPSCADIGVLGPAVGALGAMQAVEVIKELLGIEPSLSGSLAMYDAWAASIEHVTLPRRPNCPTCEAATADARLETMLSLP
ncbi:HesA/MoeB/ThiF family protein [Terrarubrum flagellatum]|uniref:HesA/MoeB/ThiF family protein n=1 Tax=Terrirubrum flagellatum TaxID=2895980 RepID=UPI00314547D3